MNHRIRTEAAHESVEFLHGRSVVRICVGPAPGIAIGAVGYPDFIVSRHKIVRVSLQKHAVEARYPDKTCWIDKCSHPAR